MVGSGRRAAAISHPRYRHLRLDLSDLSALEHACDDAFAQQVGCSERGVVGLVNNAATGEPLRPIRGLDASAVLRSFAVNAVAPMWLMGYFLRICSPETTVRIVNISSGAADRAFPGLGAYCAGKAALQMAGRVAATEVEDPRTLSERLPRRVAVVSYAPGAVDTEMQTYARSRSPEEFPWVDTFQQMLQRGDLVLPERPAREIVGLLEAPHLPSFSVQRLGQG